MNWLNGCIELEKELRQVVPFTSVLFNCIKCMINWMHILCPKIDWRVTAVRRLIPFLRDSRFEPPGGILYVRVNDYMSLIVDIHCDRSHLEGIRNLGV